MAYKENNLRKYRSLSFLVNYNKTDTGISNSYGMNQSCFLSSFSKPRTGSNYSLSQACFLSSSSTDQKHQKNCLINEEDKKGKHQMAGSSNKTHRVWDDAWTIPNAITVSRIIATPWICQLIYTDQYKTAIAAFWIAGFMDWVDGYLARKWNQQTIFGSFIDPLADKLLVGGTLLTLTAKGLIPLPLGSLIVGRDLLLVGCSFYIRNKTKPKDAGFFEMGKSAGVVSVEASMVSKFNTLFQFGLIWFTMTHLAFDIPTQNMLPVIHGIVYTSTFASGFDYYYRGNWKTIFKEKK